MSESPEARFLDPDPEFSPFPFWFWNDEITETGIRKRIADFQEKGVMGFVIHPRIGLPDDTGYLSDGFFGLVRCAVDEADRLGMKVILYDEGMYPSGSAHGMVVNGDPGFAAHGLRMSEYSCGNGPAVFVAAGDGSVPVAAVAVRKTGEGSLLPGSEITLEIPHGLVGFEPPDPGNWSVLVFSETFSGGTIRGIHFGEDDGESGAPAAADLLNPAAVKKFIRLTHERYYAELGIRFGRTIIAFFTDEPDLLGRNSKPGLKPWTPGFLESYVSGGNRPADLASLWFDAGPETEARRKKYRNSVNRRLGSSYYGQISEWCSSHGIALTGHPHDSDAVGLLKFFQIPGQDLVWRWVAPEAGLGLTGAHSTLGKCSSDAARHAGRRRNANECFGCCGPGGDHWAFSAGDMKWYLDWLFVRGVNLIYPHAFYYSLSGSRKFERPPDVGPGNIWWPYYRTISSYIKRMCWLMTDSVNVAPVAVLCEEDRLPWETVRPLYRNQIEFNYLETELLGSDACRIENGRIVIRNQGYGVLLVDDPQLLRGTCGEKAELFTRSGGTIIFSRSRTRTGGPPGLPGRAGTIMIEREDDAAAVILGLVHPDAVFRPTDENLRISRINKEGIGFCLLVNEGEGPLEGDFLVRTAGLIRIWDAWNGTVSTPRTESDPGGFARIHLRLERRESLIVSFDPPAQPDLKKIPVREISERQLKSKPNHDRIERITFRPDCWIIADIRRHSYINDGDAETGLQGTPIGAFPGMKLESLSSWSGWEGMARFSGTVVYECELDLGTPGALNAIRIDLGVVHEIAHLHVNGNDAGFRLWAPFVFDVTRFARRGVNRIRVEIANSRANELNDSGLDSGLIGPVTLEIEVPPPRSAPG